MSDFSRLSARQIAADVAARRTTAVAVAEQVLARLTGYDAIQPQVWISRFSADDILAQARAVDARIARGEALPLAGVPFAVKDNIDVAGLPTTAACPDFAYQPGRSAPVVEALMNAGAVVLGKTNLDQFATGLNGTRSPYGAPACVFNRAYISGGSSSGSAVAVAAGLAAFSVGTDTAGSGRVPAAINHLIGLKPTKGRWSTTGLTPACRSLDCISVFANDVDDAALVDEIVTVFDPSDPYSRRAGATLPIGATFRFGVPRASQLNFCGDSQSAGLYATAVARLESLGGQAVEVDIEPLSATARLLYSGPWVAERTAAVESLLRSNPDAIHPVVRGIVEGGVGMTAVEAFRGQYQLQDYARVAEAMWAGIEVLVLPTAPTIYRIAEMLAAPVALNSNLGLYTNFVNLLDMSGIAVPAGFRHNDTGFGVTFIGPAWADRALIDLARRYQETNAMAAPALDLAGKPERIKVAVVGAHLEGMPLHWQLTSREAAFVAKTRTAPVYKLYAMANTTPPKPALIHVGDGGASLEVEVYELDAAGFGSFVAEVPAPLAIGTVSLEDGTEVKGFVAEPRAIEGAEDVTRFGGWRGYIASKS
jgi:allophanate hydrolase